VLVAGSQALAGVQPGKAALDDPAVAAQARTVGDAAAGHPRRDAAGVPGLPLLLLTALAMSAAIFRQPYLWGAGGARACCRSSPLPSPEESQPAAQGQVPLRLTPPNGSYGTPGRTCWPRSPTRSR
jgi:hypothetical protein